MLCSRRYNTILFVFSLPSSCLSALPCGLVPVTSFTDSLMYIGNIPHSRDCNSCEKSKRIGTSVQITYMVKKKKCFKRSLEKGLWKLTGETVSDWQVREDLPTKAAGHFLCAECGDDWHTYWAERKEHVGKPWARHQEKQILHCGWGLSSQQGLDRLSKANNKGTPREYLSLDFVLFVVCKEEEHF